MSVSVVICAYTEARWSQLTLALESVAAQRVPARETILVIDHNPALLAAARKAFADDASLRVTENTETKGLSGARNSGVAAARGDIVAFLDDDAVADPDWLAQLVEGYRDSSVLGVGGPARPLWPGREPRWFPSEFLWVVGCSHSGMPQIDQPVRNFIGCNMSFRRSTLEATGPFRAEMGRVGDALSAGVAGCEETELCIRARQRLPGVLLYKAEARVSHHVAAARTTLRYFMRRCYAEGRSKASVVGMVGRRDGLAAERDYTLKTLPRGVKRGLKDALAGHEGVRDPMGVARAASIVLGLGATSLGYLAGRVRSALAKATGRELQAQSAPPRPVQMLELELSEPLPVLEPAQAASGERYTEASLLVRLHSKPVGIVGLTLGSGVSAEALATCIWGELGNVIQAQCAPHRVTSLSAAGLSCARQRQGLDDAPFTSVIIATHNRTESLAVCLDSLAALDYPNYEVIVVDNAPSSAATSELIARRYPTVRYVREDTPGLATAHNRGLAEARGELLAFTDDDVRVDREWLRALVRGFRQNSQGAGKVGCVTGMIVPAELETPAQRWLEQYGGFNKGFEARTFDLQRHRPDSPLYPYTAGVFGSGANMAFRREVLLELGGFDPALGAGSKGVGGDDLAAFFDVVSRGYALVYQPDAIVHHWHRRDYAGLQRQAYGYGVGLTAFLTKSVVDRPRRIFEVLPLVPRAVIYALSPTSPKNAKKQGDYPRELNRLERRGMLVGPLAYLRSRRQVRRKRSTHVRGGRAGSLRERSL